MEDKSDDPRYRWSLFVSAVLHVALIGAVMMWAAFAPKQADQPVWLELGMGGQPGGGDGGSEGGGNDAPSPPSTTPPDEPAPAPPGQPAVVEETPKPTPKFDTIKPKPTPKEDARQPVIPVEQPKKIEKPKPQPKAVVKPPPPPPKAEPTNKVKVSDKLVVRTKTGVPDSKAVNSKGTGPADSKGKSKQAARSFNADAFKKGMFNRLSGSSGGSGPGTGIGGKSGPGRGKGPGQYAGAGAGPGNRPGTGGGFGTGPGTGGGLPSEFGWYYLLIKDAMDRAWTQPSQLQGHLSCVVFIRIQRDGTISYVWFDQKSGNPVMDDSVLSAVNSVRRIRPLPPGLGNAYVDIPVAFELKPKGPG
jgi:TonB family protein